LFLVEYTIQQPGIVAADQIADGSMGVAAAIMRYMCGPAWSPIEVQLMHAPPRDPAPYRRLLGAPMRFGAERNAILFSSKWLDRRLSGADPGLRKILHDKIAELETRRAADFPTQLSTIIRTMLLAGQSVDELARRLAVNRRTLHRQLSAYHLTYEQLLDATRFDIAAQLLRNSHASMTQIAATLDYANPSADPRFQALVWALTHRMARRPPNSAADRCRITDDSHVGPWHPRLPQPRRR
jgi:AraC-like DNA-binding protein